jgi:hypothetical protein
MTGRTPDEAAGAFRDTVQRALSCVTRNVVFLTRNSGTPRPFLHDLLLSGDPAPLPGSGRTALSVRYRFTLVAERPARRPWQARTVAYYYTLSDVDGPEILGYHWHPEGMSHETAAHLHLGAALKLGRTGMMKAHLPTGHVQLPYILRLAIRDLGVRPLRSDWSEILDETMTLLAPSSA